MPGMVSHMIASSEKVAKNIVKMIGARANPKLPPATKIDTARPFDSGRMILVVMLEASGWNTDDARPDSVTVANSIGTDGANPAQQMKIAVRGIVQRSSHV